MHSRLGLGPLHLFPRLARAREASDGVCSQPMVYAAASNEVHGMSRMSPRFAWSLAALAMADGTSSSLLDYGGPFMRKSSFGAGPAASRLDGHVCAVGGGPFFSSAGSRLVVDGVDAPCPSSAAPRIFS